MPEGHFFNSTTSVTAGLNEAQLEAVTAEPGNQLIIAGAGSGKTRVLVHRIAYLIQHYSHSPFQILAVTFTNKAARVMAGRVAELLRMDTRRLWIGTFHGLANRVLRENTALASLPRDYRILAADEQRQVMKQLMKQHNIDTKDQTPTKVCNWINRAKDEGKRAEHVQPETNRRTRERIELYAIYDEYCQVNGLVDFGEILLRCHEMLLEHDGLLAEYRNRFTEILVDEFQDTNVIQYHWIRLLKGQGGHVTAVGDDDQSIYSWRGAVVQNIRDFPQDFPNTKVVRLEQNYRSTANILNAANKVIEHNKDRLGKTLWTNAEAGKPVNVFPCEYANQEAGYVLRVMDEWVRADPEHSHDDVAVLYRSHFQSRPIEALLQLSGVNYTVRGGTRFYERLEVRDALGYMQLIINRDSDLAFTRVLNLKPRGIGRISQRRLSDFATVKAVSLWAAAGAGIASGTFSKALADRLSVFLAEIDQLMTKCEGKTLEEIATICISDSGLMAYHMGSAHEEDIRDARRENLQEMIRGCGEFEERITLDSVDIEGRSVLQYFLDSVSLDTGDIEEDFGPSVSLMTLHAAKGLEFPLVFIIGMAEGIFPHERNENDPVRLNEERRLAYVGLTRAMAELHLTYSAGYNSYDGQRNVAEESRFVNEIPDEYLNYVTPRRKSAPKAIVGRRRLRRGINSFWQ